MNKRIIEQVINKKVQGWLNSIEDSSLRKYLDDKIIVTGGCITSMLLKEEVNDFDIYFTTKDAVIKVCDYYVAKFLKNHPGFKKEILIADGAVCGKDDKYVQYGLTPERVAIIVKSAGVAGEEEDTTDPEVLPDEDGSEKPEEKEDKNKKREHKPVYLTSNAITLSDKIQLIIRFYGDAAQIHENFDYLHCTNYWESAKAELHLNEAAMEAILAKELKYVGSKYPLCSLIRMRKFIKRGWTINAGQILKMCYQVSKLDLDKVEVLADQLVGVDTTYFSHLITKMQEAKEQNSQFELGYSYLAELIDEMF
jgi:hypothetical protein